jgi:anti-anti-sigma factor
MTLEVTITAAELAAILATKGPLDAKISQIFRPRRDDATEGERKEIVIDCGALETLDAASAGMLMFFNYAAKAKGKRISIAGASAPVLHVLNRAHLGRLLTVR